jgi:cytochrome c peroxidase
MSQPKWQFNIERARCVIQHNGVKVRQENSDQFSLFEHAVLGKPRGKDDMAIAALQSKGIVGLYIMPDTGNKSS